MRRQKQSTLKDLVDIAAHLPWKAAGVVLALIAYFGFRYAASFPMVPVATSDMKAYSQSIGHSVGRQLLAKQIYPEPQNITVEEFAAESASSFVRPGVTKS